MSTTRRRALGAALSTLAATGLAGAARAQSRQPDGPVTLIVGSTAGTGNDILARLMAPHLQARFGVPFVVDNRTGASGVIAAQAVNRAAPDGRTLLVLGDPFVTNPSLMPSLPFDPIGGFTFLLNLAHGAIVLAVRPDLPAQDVRGFVEMARAAPQPMTYASPGSGTPHHMIMELFRLNTRITLTHVPYRGSAQAVQDLMGQRVDAMMLPVHVALPLARDRRIRILAIGTDRRAAEAPEIPTLAEAGFPMTNVTLWYGLFGPPGMPADLTQRYNAEVNAWLALPETQERLRAQGMSAAGGTPEAFRTQIAADIQHWARVIREGGIKAD
ncbi:MAG: tripartite tricarboxylate transporter substrate binding protein [Roseomonas sp.]|jgi:tripartite-type tricarboxylate transporter receptor subunit TctC|nr:tripartite tricarboxylate transporter substrate binding protein [Roseomonas sp.]